MNSLFICTWSGVHINCFRTRNHRHAETNGASANAGCNHSRLTSHSQFNHSRESVCFWHYTALCRLVCGWWFSVSGFCVICPEVGRSRLHLPHLRPNFVWINSPRCHENRLRPHLSLADPRAEICLPPPPTLRKNSPQNVQRDRFGSVVTVVECGCWWVCRHWNRG